MSVSVALDITEQIKPPRAVFVPFMMGHHFGVPFHRDLQRQILLAMLSRIEAATKSPDILALAVTWAAARRQGIEIERTLGHRP